MITCAVTHCSAPESEPLVACCGTSEQHRMHPSCVAELVRHANQPSCPACRDPLLARLAAAARHRDEQHRLEQAQQAEEDRAMAEAMLLHDGFIQQLRATAEEEDHDVDEGEEEADLAPDVAHILRQQMLATQVTICSLGHARRAQTMHALFETEDDPAWGLRGFWRHSVVP